MNRKSKTFLFYAGMVLIVFLGTAVLAEIGFRAYHLANKKRRYIYIPDFTLGYRLAPNNSFEWWGDDNHPEFRTHQKTNSLGLLGDEISLRKDPDSTRVLVMGDSITEAFQVEPEDKYTSLLERHLRQRSGETIEVINAGVRGYSPIHQYLRYKTELHKLKPDVVLLQVFANDVFEDNKTKTMSIVDENGLPLRILHYFDERVVNGGNPEDYLSPPPLHFLHRFLMNRLRIYEYIFYYRSKLQRKSDFNLCLREQAEFHDAYQFFIIQDHNEEDLFGDARFGEKLWGQTRDYLAALNREVEQSGAQLILVYVPVQAQLPLKEYGENTRMYFNNLQANRRLNRYLKEFAEKNDVPFLDLLDTFIENKDKNLYFSFDGHLTEEGHRLVADELYKFLVPAHEFFDSLNPPISP